MGDAISIGDFILTPIYLIIIFLLAKKKVAAHIEKDAYYKYYIPGLFAKIFGGIGVCLIYVYYYGGGDTLNYLHDGRLLVSMLFRKPAAFFEALQYNTISPWEWYSLDKEVGGDFPSLGVDQNSWFVVKCVWPFILLAFNCFIPTTILLNYVTFSAAWRLYKIFVAEFPKLHKEFAIAVFFIPSVAFWGQPQPRGA